MKTRLKYQILAITPVFFLAVILGLLDACGSKKEPTCLADKDCPINKICMAGECVSRTQRAADVLPAILPGQVKSCSRMDACPVGYTCHLAEERCMRLTERLDGKARISHVFPTRVAPGDLITIDGEDLATEIMMRYHREHADDPQKGDLRWPDVFIGTQKLMIPEELAADRNRIVVRAPPQIEGELRFEYPGTGETMHSGIAITSDVNPWESIQCAEGTAIPEQTELPPTPADKGPYGAAYIDAQVPDAYTRVYYPGMCSGNRRPPALGRFPLVMILHGNGATHINYDYLGFHLASWGYIVALPMAVHPLIMRHVAEIGLNAPDIWFRFLEDRVAGKKVVVIAHSRGAERAEVLAETGFRDVMAGLILLGPFSTFEHPVGAPSLIIASDGDRQATLDHVFGMWQAQPSPSILAVIQGGNHGQFTDSKHWESNASTDAHAKISRNRQHLIIQSYVLPFIQRAFDQDTPYDDWLSGKYFTKDVQFNVR